MKKANAFLKPQPTKKPAGSGMNASRGASMLRKGAGQFIPARLKQTPTGPMPQPQHAPMPTGAPSSRLNSQQLQSGWSQALQAGKMSVQDYYKTRQAYGFENRMPFGPTGTPAPSGQLGSLQFGPSPTVTPTPSMTPAPSATAFMQPTPKPPIQRASPTQPAPTSVPQVSAVGISGRATTAKQQALTMIRPEYQQYFAGINFYDNEVPGFPQVASTNKGWGSYVGFAVDPNTGMGIPGASITIGDAVPDNMLQTVALYEFLNYWADPWGGRVSQDFYSIAEQMGLTNFGQASGFDETYAAVGYIPSQIPPELRQFYPMFFGAQP